MRKPVNGSAPVLEGCIANNTVPEWFAIVHWGAPYGARDTVMADFPVRYPKWQPQLTAAINETDPAKLLERAREVEEIFSGRLDRISGSRSHSEEIQAIEQAMDVLEVLKRRARQAKAS
jgi:hypothetical protein